jgi:hypothetical protein
VEKMARIDLATNLRFFAKVHLSGIKGQGMIAFEVREKRGHVLAT